MDGKYCKQRRDEKRFFFKKGAKCLGTSGFSRYEFLSTVWMQDAVKK
jgi:hypothetical protein